jgi:hypothetical protein
MFALQQELGRVVQKGLAEMADRCRGKIKQGGGLSSGELEAEIAMLLGQVNERLDAGLADVLSRLREDFAVDGVGVDPYALELPALDPEKLATPDAQMDLRSMISMAMSASMGRSLGQTVGSLFGPGGAMLGGWIGGALSLAATFVNRGQATAQQGAADALTHVIEHVRIELPPRLATRIADVSRQLDLGLLDALERADSDLKGAVEAADATARASESERVNRVTQAKGRLKNLDRVRTTLDKLASEAASAVSAEATDASPPPALATVP